MILLTEIRLPLGHSTEDLQSAILQRLQIKAAALRSYSVARRGYDARKRSSIIFVYSINADVEGEAALLEKFSHEVNIKLIPKS